MSATNDAVVVMTTVEKSEDGERLARVLIDSGLAACIQILPTMVSIYRWEGKIERESEILMLIKTTRVAFPALETAIKQNHPYQTPEIISLPVLHGSAEYLEWVTGNVLNEPSDPSSLRKN